MEKVLALLEKALAEKEFINSTWSNPKNKTDYYAKISAKPVEMKESEWIQFACLKDNKESHVNVKPEEAVAFMREHCIGYKQIQIYTSSADYQCLVNKKGEANIKRKGATKSKPISLAHNRKKQYILDNEQSKGFLTHLGLMDGNGQIKPSKYDKYKQINKYLETIETIMPHFETSPIRIVDFGCGKSYLTFAMYHYFNDILGKEIEIIGLDLKQDVIAFCNQLADELDYTHLNFQVGDIGQYTTNQRIDGVVSLHACNTATDAALSKAIGWQAKVILAVPCCHNECYTQIQNDTLAPLLKHGILKERMASLITDGLRAQMLEACGYKVNVMEFIDMEHTPKNILIKAIRQSDTPNLKAYETYQSLSQELHLNLTLNQLIQF
ncbi:MAG: class I SAM-dependent methyltransferase [Cellulosilyticaceae bacterium]